MLQGNLSADVIVIIAIAVFVLFKYRQVLGHKTGHDVETPRSNKRESEERVVQLRQYQEDGDKVIEGELVEPEDKTLESLKDDSVKADIEKIKTAEPSFTLDEFLRGAKSAFEMVMEAFEKEDRQTLKNLLSEELYREFDQELKSFAKAGKRPHTTLVSIVSLTPVSAELEKQQAKITLRFVTEQIHVVKDKEGAIVEGEVSRIDQVEDEWVYERNLKSRNPNWTITDM